MVRVIRFLSTPDVLAVLFLAATPFIYFWRITLAQGVFFTTDIVRLFYPFGLELARALSEARLPLWTPGVLAGFPLFAEGQVGALYPPNLFLYRFLPTHFALSYGIILHLAWAACGMYAWVRAQNLRSLSALLAGFVYMFNGTIFGHLSHPSVIAAMAWLPWLLFFQNRFVRAYDRKQPRAAVWFFLMVLGFGVQYLAGSVQIAFLNTLAFGVIAFVAEAISANAIPARTTVRQIFRSALWVALPIILGVGIAAIQLLPTSELIGYSSRSEASASFVTSYSLPLDFLPQFVFPYPRDEPSEATGEYWAYFGIAPLLLALIAPFVRRERRTFFFVVFALGALALALGELNPAYQVISRLPPFSFFRVPARYLYLFVFAASFLAALSLDELMRRWGDPARKRIALLFVVPVALVIWLMADQPLGFWLSAWQILPWLFGLFSIGVLGLARFKFGNKVFAGLLVGLTIVDLAVYAPPFLVTIDEITPVASIGAAPRSISALQAKRTSGRVITDESVFPSMPALRASLFSNTALMYGWESVQAYSSLAFSAHQTYSWDMSPAMLNLLNVRYLMIPLEPRPRTKASTPTQASSLDVLNNETVIASTLCAAIELATYTEQAANLPNGTVVGEMDLRRKDGRVTTVPIRVGIETADWDYERKRVTNEIKHTRAPIAHSFPAFWRSFARTFEGNTYLARWNFTPAEIVGINVRAVQPEARLAVESVKLVDERGNAQSLAALTGKNDFTLAYLSDTVATWENGNVLPRAFVVHGAQLLNDEEMLARLKEPGFRPDRTVLLGNGQPMPNEIAAQSVVQVTRSEPERVTLTATTDQPGYLVLADSWYPGWRAVVDGVETPIYRADMIFRAVPLTPGRHSVSFEYQPRSFLWGAILSGVSLLFAGCVARAIKSEVQKKRGLPV